MPGVIVNRSKFFQKLGKKMSDEEFADLCFEFGIELDDITSENMMAAKGRGENYDLSEEKEELILYKIDVPANRYDLLCIEGLTRALRIFLKLEKVPGYKLTNPSSLISLVAKENVKELRPIVVCAIIRDFTFNEEIYDSFIDLQEKLHKNICRERKLVSIGTHDLDTLSPPFSYLLDSPNQIVFTPLQKNSILEFSKKQNTDPLSPITATHLFEILKTDEQLKKYLKLIENNEKWPVIKDSKGVVLSLPPILNGEHSKIKLSTKNIFIEITALDWTKANIVLNTFVSMFSEYSKTPFLIEPVKVIDYEGKERITPNLEDYEIKASKKYIEKGLGITLEKEKIEELLLKMGLKSIIEGDNIKVSVPVTRSDIMQECDIWEDVAIAYGYNKLPIQIPQTKCFGKQNSLNQLTDHIRHQIAESGFIELLTEVLISITDNYTNLSLNYDLNNSSSVLLERSTTKMKESFEIARTHLLPCLLKTMKSNKSAPLPLRLFEVSDVVLKDEKSDTGAKNERHLAVIYSNTSAGFEIVHGLLDRLFSLLQFSPFFISKSTGSYKLVKASHNFYFTGANIEIEGKGVVGHIGVIHPNVLEKFDLVNPCSAFEINIEHFL